MKAQLLITLFLTALSFNTSFAGGPLTAESSSVKKMYNTIQTELHIPAKIIRLCEDSVAEIIFTVDSLGYVTVLESDSECTLLNNHLQKQLSRIKSLDAGSLQGERFKLKLQLKS